jgi:hypothetical protein
MLVNLTPNWKEMEQSNIKPERWYNREIFPLIPKISYKKGDKYNTPSLSFRWLFFRFWTLDTFEFELSIVMDGHWGLGVIGILPYLRWVICIPCPTSLSMWMYNNLSRKPRG